MNVLIFIRASQITGLFLILLTAVVCNKYSEDANTAKPFRSKFLNDLWIKITSKELKQSEIQQLRTWLHEMDQVYMEIKHDTKSGSSADAYASLNSKVEKILGNYGIGDLMKSEPGFGDAKREIVNDPSLKSKKLNDIMNSARASRKFDDTELESLQGELMDFQKRIDDIGDSQDNSVDDEKTKTLGKISKQISILEEHVSQGEISTLSSDAEEKMKFLTQLLEDNKDKFTTHEFDVLEEEFEHYKSRLRKLANLETILSKTPKTEKNPQKDKLKEDIDHHSRYVKKMHDYLVSSIRRSEL